MTGLHSLAGKKCIITGGSRGIGLAIARRFVSEGADVTLMARNQDSLSRAVEELRKISTRPGQDVKGFPGNVASRDSWDELFSLPHTEKLDILVNCAGVSQRSILWQTSAEQVKTILETNLEGAISGCHYASKSMSRTRKGGCIINVSSVLAGRKGMAGTSVYAASKAGLLGLTTSLAVELGSRGIRVNALLPGYIKTDMTDFLSEDKVKEIPLGRTGHADEVADAAAFLSKNPYASNCILNLDGGLSAI